MLCRIKYYLLIVAGAALLVLFYILYCCGVDGWTFIRENNFFACDIIYSVFMGKVQVVVVHYLIKKKYRKISNNRF